MAAADAGTWMVTDVQVKGDSLIFEVGPAYGNRRQYHGKMRMEMDAGMMQALKEALDEKADTSRLQERARQAWEAFQDDVKQQAQAKREELKKAFSLTDDDLPDEMKKGNGYIEV